MSVNNDSRAPYRGDSNQQFNYACPVCDHQTTIPEIERLRAENTRMREALEAIRDCGGGPIFHDTDVAVARVALDSAAPKEEDWSRHGFGIQNYPSGTDTPAAPKEET